MINYILFGILIVLNIITIITIYKVVNKVLDIKVRSLSQEFMQSNKKVLQDKINEIIDNASNSISTSIAAKVIDSNICDNTASKISNKVLNNLEDYSDKILKHNIEVDKKSGYVKFSRNGPPGCSDHLQYRCSKCGKFEYSQQFYKHTKTELIICGQCYSKLLNE